MAKSRSDEHIIAALLEHGTVKEAARAIGISPRAIYDRMRGKDFRGLYSEARAEITRQAVLTLNRNLAAAVETIAEVMTDKNNPAATRLQAAKMILENAGKFSERLAGEEAETRKLTGTMLDNMFD